MTMRLFEYSTPHGSRHVGREPVTAPNWPQGGPAVSVATLCIYLRDWGLDTISLASCPTRHPNLIQ